MPETRELTPGTYVFILDNGRCIGSGKVTDDEHDTDELPVRRVGECDIMRIRRDALEWHPQNDWGLPE